MELVYGWVEFLRSQSGATWESDNLDLRKKKQRTARAKREPRP